MGLQEKIVFNYINTIQPEPQSVRIQININLSALALNMSEDILSDALANLIKNRYLEKVSGTQSGTKSIIGRNNNGSPIIREQFKDILVTVIIRKEL